jgi:hypothetical protein
VSSTLTINTNLANSTSNINALENNDSKLNYGIYVNGGLLVETCSIFRMNNKSNLVLFDN